MHACIAHELVALLSRVCRFQNSRGSCWPVWTAGHVVTAYKATERDAFGPPLLALPEGLGVCPPRRSILPLEKVVHLSYRLLQQLLVFRRELPPDAPLGL